MKKITFDEEEMFVIAVFNPDTRSNTIHIMSEVLPELKDDQDMFDLLLSAMEKLKRISDDEYKEEVVVDGLEGYGLEDENGDAVSHEEYFGTDSDDDFAGLAGMSEVYGEDDE
jgi:hypothetical protein